MYTIIVDESIDLFLNENKIKASKYLKNIFKAIMVFPRCKPSYKGNDLYRTFEIPELRINGLYKIDDVEKIIYVVDMKFTTSSMGFKM